MLPASGTTLRDMERDYILQVPAETGWLIGGRAAPRDIWASAHQPALEDEETRDFAPPAQPASVKRAACIGLRRPFASTNDLDASLLKMVLEAWNRMFQAIADFLFGQRIGYRPDA
jgi:hypothetical protein